MTTLTFTRSGSRRLPVQATPVRAATEIRPGQVEETLSLVSSAFTMLTILCLWFVLQLLVLSGFSQDRSQELLYSQFRGELAAATAPVGPVTPAGDPVAILSIPEVDLKQVVVEGTASGDLLAGPGHRRDTVLPGQQGTSVVYGRATTYGRPFGHLKDLRVGDKIYAQTGQARTVFVVDSIRGSGDPLPQPPKTGQSRLVLVTGGASGFLGALRSSEVRYVDAIASTAQVVPSGRPTAIPAGEQVMKGDSTALPMLALALGLLTALTLAVVAARQRWSAALVWVIASPVAIALSWFTTDEVMRLLPNLL